MFAALHSEAVMMKCLKAIDAFTASKLTAASVKLSVTWSFFSACFHFIAVLWTSWFALHAASSIMVHVE